MTNKLTYELTRGEQISFWVGVFMGVITCIAMIAIIKLMESRTP